MEFVTGTYHDGRIDLGRPVDWPDGTEVAVNRRIAATGMAEEAWPRTPEGIEQLIREWDALQAFEVTVEEAADFERVRKEMGQTSMAKLDRFTEQP